MATVTADRTPRIACELSTVIPSRACDPGYTAYHWCPQTMQSRGVILLEESPDTTGQGRSVTPTRGNPRESATETIRPMARPHVSRAQAKVKWCGKGAPAPR